MKYLPGGNSEIKEKVVVFGSFEDAMEYANLLFKDRKISSSYRIQEDDNVESDGFLILLNPGHEKPKFWAE